MFEEDNHLKVEWSDLDCFKQWIMISMEASNIFKDVDVIVGILNGGAVFTMLLANTLNKPVVWVRASSYNGEIPLDEVTISGDTSELQSLRGKRIIIVDDLLDTGKTMNKVVDLLIDVSREILCSVTMFRKQPNDVLPLVQNLSYKVIPINKWVVFPWELKSYEDS